jgi:hypothetical protein
VKSISKVDKHGVPSFFVDWREAGREVGRHTTKKMDEALVEELPPTPEAVTRDSDDDLQEKKPTAYIRPSDEEILQQERALKKEFEAAPAVSEFKSFLELQQEYENGHEIVKGKLDVLFL